MAHTTNLDVPGLQPECRAWMIHDGDFSGETTVSWEVKDERGLTAVRKVVLPSGFLRAIMRSVLTSSLPGILEGLMDRLQAEFWRRHGLG